MQTSDPHKYIIKLKVVKGHVTMQLDYVHNLPIHAMINTV